MGKKYIIRSSVAERLFGIKEGNEDFMNMDMDLVIDKALTNFINRNEIKKIYPMVDNIKVYSINNIGRLIFAIRVNDPEMNEDNMYERGLDPHYLVDNYISKILPYFGIPKNRKSGFIVVGTDGETFDGFFP